MKPWWETYPERLEYELEALRNTAIQFDPPHKDNKTGVLSIKLTVRHHSELIRLLAEYPPFFPYVRFEVFAPELNLNRHQNPFAKNLCLLGRSSTNWSVDDTLASILSDQLPRLIQAATEEDHHAVEGVEAQQPEPFSYYYNYIVNSIVYVDSDWDIDSSISRGRFQLAIESLSPFRASIVQVEDDGRNEIAKAGWDASGKEIIGRWIRASEEIREQSAEKIFENVKKIDVSLSEPRWYPVSQEQIDVIGVLYPEETQWRSRSNGWLFLIRFQDRHIPGRARRADKYTTYLVRTGRAGFKDIQSRAPELEPIQGKQVSIVGSGALGGPSAIECARCGVQKLNLMDSDFVEPGNSVRWPLGFSAAGFLKIDALSDFIKRNYPYVQIKSFPYRLGAPSSLCGATLNEYDDFFNNTGLVIDCTAEEGIHYPLSDLARDRKIPYVAMSGTPGLWGGRVLRFIPGRTAGCWNCLCHWLHEKVISSPPSDPQGEVIPAGCAEPTFTGANYNALQIASFGIRFAIDALNTTPQFEFDLCNVAFRSATGASIVPTWTPFKIERHTKCENH
jgi:hypothetical protein